MEKRAFGAGGPAVPVIGQGTWNMEHDAGSASDRAEVIAALRRGLDLGMTHVDTAELYGYGRVEELVGEAIEGRRDEVFLVSKVMPQNASRRGTIQACEKSLRKLRTDRLDCYLLHWIGSHPLEATIEAFGELAKAGKIRSWGVSNFDEDDLASAVKIAGAGKVVCNQVLHHLEQRAIEHAVVPYCEANGIAVVSYSPFGGAGKFPSSRSAGGKVLAEIAKERGATPRQIALAFLLRTSPSVLVIPKASKVAKVEDNAGAAALTLTDDDLARIDRAFPRGPRAPGVPSL